MFNPAPPPPPPASVDKSTEFPPEILNAFVPSLNDSVCAEPVSSVAFSKVVNLVPIDDDTDGNVVSLKLVFAVIEFFWKAVIVVGLFNIELYWTWLEPDRVPAGKLAAICADDETTPLDAVISPKNDPLNEPVKSNANFISPIKYFYLYK